MHYPGLLDMCMCVRNCSAFKLKSAKIEIYLLKLHISTCKNLSKIVRIYIQCIKFRAVLFFAVRFSAKNNTAQNIMHHKK